HRMAAAADHFADRVTEGLAAAVRASRDLADDLDAERRRLANVTPARADIRDAHARMLAALEGYAAAIRFLADVLASREDAQRERARARLHDAEARWRQGVEGVRRVCPG